MNPLPEVPPADDLTADWWQATCEHRLVLQTCTGCGHHQHPPRAVCVRCGDTTRLGFTEASGDGTVDTFTVVHRAPRRDLAVPYTIARVRLAEGPLLLTRLDGLSPGTEPDDDADDAGWRIGDPVTVDWVDLPDGRALPVFRRPTPRRPTPRRPTPADPR
ncbi:Zn-ribbon domain-containing OB-fold protein [Micromonospora sp. LOL_014]|uniref:Zn-ribbon domain-containing OB-fold protein n=1 Tax=Micromonospora sp. LOL_014 TaxID=3345415 RepID=UPI003A884547